MVKNITSTTLVKTEFPIRETYSRVIAAEYGISTANKPQANNIKMKIIDLSRSELLS